MLPAFSEDDDKNSAGASSQKEKVKNRTTIHQHHSSINLTSLANQNITTVPISAETSATLAAQGVNVCPELLYSGFINFIYLNKLSLFIIIYLFLFYLFFRLLC